MSAGKKTKELTQRQAVTAPCTESSSSAVASVMSWPEHKIGGRVWVPRVETKRHAERLDALEAENERLRAELATARKDALEEAAKVCDKLAQAIYDEHGSTDPETGERMIPTRLMDSVEAYEECAEQIRALKREGGV